MRAAIVLVVASACSIPTKELAPDDALQAPFGCLNQPLPTTAPIKVTIAGTVIDPFAGTMLGDAAVEGFLVGVGSSIFTVNSDAAGAFTHDQGTGGAPINGFLKVSLNGFLDSYFYPATPVAHDLHVQVELFSSMDIMTLGNIAQVTIDPTKAQLLVSVTDCNGLPLPGATITTVPAGTIRYFVGNMPSPTATATDAVTGAALIANAPPSNTTVNATVSGMTLRSHNFDTVAGALTQTEIRP
jgi:hypothetical protein